MNIRSLIIAGSLAIAALPITASAQATRTWVSGVGDDANPCSRTAPCKTFAGAISKTATGGEINAIDAGPFGNLTITKSLTINGEGNFAGILASGGTTAFVVNAPAGSTVIIKGIDINGAGTGNNGVNFINGGSLIIDNCMMVGFTGSGINAAPTAGGAKLQVNNCRIYDNDTAGIFLRPSGAGNLIASVTNTLVQSNGAGLRADAGATMTAENVISTGNSFNGFIANTGGAINAHRCVASNNLNGVAANGGIARISDMTIMGNSGTGILPVTANSIVSFGDNKVAGNTTDGQASSGTTAK